MPISCSPDLQSLVSLYVFPMFSSKPRLGGGVEVMNLVDEARFPLLVSRVAQSVHTAATEGSAEGHQVFSTAELDKLHKSLELERPAVDLLVESLLFVFKQAAFHAAKPAALQEQLEAEGLSRERATACAQVWAGVAKSTVEALGQHDSCPLQLASVKWSLGARLASSSQTNERTPLARLQFDLESTEDTQPEPVVLELDHERLVQLFDQLEHVQARLDGLQ